MFKSEDIISTYTDDRAVEDGMLVDVTTRDRCTAALFAALVRDLPKGTSPPDRWPVALFEWFAAGKGEAGDNKRALAAVKGMIGTHATEATRVYEENIGGGIFTLWMVEKDGAIVALTETEPDAGGSKVWLIPNEVGGVTAMFPEDY